MSRARTASSAVHESQLIGSILADEEPRERESGVEVKDPIAARSTSAPPQLAIQDGTSVNGETILPDDLRLSPEYYNYYYSQKPLDPRLPPPVFNWSSWHYATRGRGAFGGISEKDFIVRAGLKLGDSASLTKEKATIPSGTTTSAPDVAPTSTPPATSPVLSSVGPLGLDEPSTEYLLSRKGKSQTHPSTHIFSVASSASTSPRLQARTETFEDLERDLSRRFSGGLTFRPAEPEMERETFDESGTSTSVDTDRVRLSGTERDRAEHASGAFPSPSLFPSAMSVPYAGGLGGPRRPFSGSLRQTAPVGTASGGLTSSVPHMYPTSFRSLHGTNPVMAVMGYGHSTMLRGRTPELGPSMVSGGSIGRESGGLSRESFPRRPTTWVPDQSFSSKPSHGTDRTARPSYPREGRHKGRRSHAAFPATGPGLTRDAETKSFVRDHSPLGKSRPAAGPTLALDPSSRSWLDDFRLNKTNSNLTLKDVVSRGLMLELATDQYGSRFIQQKLETASGEEKQAAFEQLLPETLRLCTDVFGNYVIQKFFEHGTFEHKRLLASKLTGNVLMLSLQMYGCRVVQKAIDVSDADTQALLVRELNGHVMECVKDQNGNHVIQKCIEKVPPYLIQFIVEAFSHQIFNLSTHPYGCRVIQRLLENCSEAQRNSILSEILENVEDLCKNQYGNYVIQHVLVRGTPFHRGNIIRAVRGKVLVLAKHKFASNVIEKCFAHASRQHRAALVEEVLGKEDRDPSKSPLIAMVKDQYANYVIQKMVDVVDEEQRAMILHRIKRHVPNLRKIPYGKHIIARIEKLTGKPIS